MFDYPPTVILRHRKENKKKCSLRGLESRSDCLFFTYPLSKPMPVEGYIFLTFDGPQLSASDKEYGLLILDSTWRYLPKMKKNTQLPDSLIKRSLPTGLKTAYPRVQTDCPDPERGLASIEALIAAYAILGRPYEELLSHYYWSDEFLKINRSLSLFE